MGFSEIFFLQIIGTTSIFAVKISRWLADALMDERRQLCGRWVSRDATRRILIIIVINSIIIIIILVIFCVIGFGRIISRLPTLSLIR